MNDDSSLLTQVKEALALDGDPNSIKHYYAKWAKTYDADLVDAYTGPSVMVGFLLDAISKAADPTALQGDIAQVMDAGCGTGLVGKLLNDRGYQNLDGTDLSQEMVNKAEELKIYRALTGNLDLAAPLPTSWHERYDIVTCCGVFTLGHVPPEVLQQLFLITKPSGLVATSVRTAYYENSSYQQISDEVVKQGVAAVLSQQMNAPYTSDGQAHYWVYQKA